MLVVKVDLWPYGFQGNERNLGQIRIANVGGGEVCNYVYLVWEPSPVTGEPEFACGILPRYNRNAPVMHLLDAVTSHYRNRVLLRLHPSEGRIVKRWCEELNIPEHYWKHICD